MPHIGWSEVLDRRKLASGWRSPATVGVTTCKQPRITNHHLSTKRLWVFQRNMLLSPNNSQPVLCHRLSSAKKTKQKATSLPHNFWSGIWGNICTTFTVGLPGMGWLLPLPKCPLRRANPWVQDLCKHASVLPYPVPPKVNTHRMAPWEQPPPQLGVSLLDCRFFLPLS